MENNNDTKKITLRLGDDDLKQIEKLKDIFSITTVNSLFKKILNNYILLYDKSISQSKKIKELENENFNLKTNISSFVSSFEKMKNY